jgi:hypothetical protein
MPARKDFEHRLGGRPFWQGERARERRERHQKNFVARQDKIDSFVNSISHFYQKM